MYNKYRNKKPIIVKKTKYSIVDTIRLNEVLRQVQQVRKTQQIVTQTPTTYIIEEV